MMLSSAKAVVLYAHYTTRLSYYDDWLDAFRTSRHFDVTAINICEEGVAGRLRAIVREADLLVLLHSTNGDTTIYLEPLVDILAQRRGRLVAFIGNELNLPGSPISAKRQIMKLIGPDCIATQLVSDSGEFLWGDVVKSKVLSMPHALNAEAFRIETPSDQRPVDIGVRAVKYIPHLGDDDRNRLHNFFVSHDFWPDLRVDIGTERLDRTEWAKFLNQCKGTVSSEAGSWFLEKDDATIETIRRNVMRRHEGWLVIPNDSPLRRFGHKMPWWLRMIARKILSRGFIQHESTINEQLKFSEIYDEYFKGRPVPQIYGKCISSRHFDAIGTGTCQILLAGRYNDILEPGVHYLSLKSDFSNINEVMARFMDPAERNRVAEAALNWVTERHTYAHRMAYLYEQLSAL